MSVHLFTCPSVCLSACLSALCVECENRAGCRAALGEVKLHSENLRGCHKAAFIQLNGCFLQAGATHPNSNGTPLSYHSLRLGMQSLIQQKSQTDQQTATHASKLWRLKLKGWRFLRSLGYFLLWVPVQLMTCHSYKNRSGNLHLLCDWWARVEVTIKTALMFVLHDLFKNAFRFHRQIIFPVCCDSLKPCRKWCKSDFSSREKISPQRRKQKVSHSNSVNVSFQLTECRSHDSPHRLPVTGPTPSSSAALVWSLA